MKKKNILVIFCLFLITGFFGGCGLKKSGTVTLKENIEIWGVWDDSDVISDLITQYKSQNATVKDIKYRKFSADEYERELIEAMASDQGPDIFLAHNTWLTQHGDKMISLGEAIKIYNDATEQISGCSRPPLIEEPLLTERQYADTFVDVAHNDFVKNGQIYGIPLTVDTLALFYNVDLLNAAGISTPPKTWNEFEEVVQRLTIKDEYNNVTQAGAALGTAENVNRSADILALMMLQNGCPITDQEENSVELSTRVQRPGSKEMFSPALEAMNYYTSFANGSSPNYTWNPRMFNSIDSFQAGQSAMLLNYTYTIQTIKSKAPKLNFKVAAIPQVEGVEAGNKLAYANYWGYVVSRNSATTKNKPIEAWKFLLFLGEKEQQEFYVKETQQAAARRDVLKTQIDDPTIGVFAEQALIAKSWYQPDVDEMESIIDENIENVTLGWQSTEQAIREMQNKFDVILKEYKAKN